MDSKVKWVWQAFLAQLAISAFLAYFLWQRFWLPNAYYAGSIIIAVIVSVLVVRGSRYSTVALFAAYLLTRNIYYLASQYKIHPFFDPWWSYGVVESISAFGVVPVFAFGESFLTNMLSWPSEWPLLPIVTSILSQISGISTFSTSLIMVQILLTLIFISVHLLITKLSHTLDFDKRFSAIAILIYVATPETLFWFSMFKYEVLAISFFTLFLFLHFMQSTNALEVNKARAFITIVLLTGVVLSHHFVSLITAFYLLLFTSCYYITYIFRPLRASFDISRSQRLGVFLAGAIFLWWTNYTSRVILASGALLQRLIHLFTEIWTMKPAFLVSGWYPSSLTPTWALNLLILRDFLLYIPILLGFGYLCFRYIKERNPNLHFAVLSLLSFGLLASINFITTDVGLTRIIPYAMPFFAFSSASFFFVIEKFFVKFRVIVTGLIVLICMVLIFSSFIGLWGHKYVPAHLYDTSISWLDIGEHNPMFHSVKNFIMDYVEIERFNQVITDDVATLIVILPPEYYFKAMRSYDQPWTRSILFVELNQLNIYSYSEAAALPFFRSERAWSEIKYYDQKIELRQVVKFQLNCIYSNGNSRLHFRK